MVAPAPWNSPGCFRQKAGKLYAALLAAGRDDEATAVAEKAVCVDSTALMRVQLVETALKYKQPRAAQRALLEPAEKDETAGAAARALRERLETALKSK